jgi:hypothetical protein
VCAVSVCSTAHIFEDTMAYIHNVDMKLSAYVYAEQAYCTGVLHTDYSNDLQYTMQRLL